MARTTISLPDQLVARLEPFKDRINVSEVCRGALEARVLTYEQIQETLAIEDVMERLVARLRIEKEESVESSRQFGREHGEQWAINEASYDEFRLCLSEYTEIREGTISPEDLSHFPTDSKTAHKYYMQAASASRNDDKLLDHNVYTWAFLSAVHEVWQKVVPELYRIPKRND